MGVCHISNDKIGNFFYGNLFYLSMSIAWCRSLAGTKLEKALNIVKNFKRAFANSLTHLLSISK